MEGYSKILYDAPGESWDWFGPRLIGPKGPGSPLNDPKVAFPTISSAFPTISFKKWCFIE